jgi:acyl-coenzyme A synthetase/AMP-(fatty) acid ligase
MAPVYPQSLLASLEADAEVPAFEQGSRIVTRGEILHLIACNVGGLRSAVHSEDLKLGTGIAIATGVTPEGFAIQIAAHVLGLRIVVLKPGLPADQLPYFLTDVSILVVDETAGPDLLTGCGLKPLRLTDLCGEPVELVSQGQLESVAVVVYTSGSTGVPKGVECTYKAMTEMWAWQRDSWNADTERLASRYSRFMLFGTLASAVMWEHLGLCLIGGGTAVIPSMPMIFPQILVELRISAVLCTVPRLYGMLDAIRSNPVDLSNLQSIIIAGSPLPPHRLRAAMECFGDAAHQAYGTTETGKLCLLTATDLAAHPDAVTSVGRAFSGAELVVRDDNGNPVADGIVGHVWARTPGQFRGYTNEDSSDMLDADGWVWTKDLGSLDTHGFLHLVGRSRDVIIINAIVYYAAAIESALVSHPDVDAAYVVGVPDEKTGETARAFIVAVDDRGPHVDYDALRMLVETKLGPAAVPTKITVVDSIPTLPSGKPDKQALLDKEDLQRGSAELKSSQASPILGLRSLYSILGDLYSRLVSLVTRLTGFI